LLYARLNYVVLKQAVNFSADDKFLPHEVSEVVLKEIQAQLDKVRGLSEALLVRKVLEGSERVYVLAVLAGYSWNEGVNAKHLDPMFEDLRQVHAPSLTTRDVATGRGSWRSTPEVQSGSRSFNLQARIGHNKAHKARLFAASSLSFLGR
jgi:hypothetical protein